MCGIAGIFKIREKAIHVSFLVRMAEIQEHRGPDGEGFALLDMGPLNCSYLTRQELLNNHDNFNKCGFAHRRLSIIDLSDMARQPMANVDGSIWIIYNGECFNYIELRQELKGSGCEFVTDSDTEVVLKSYEVWGTDCFHKFNGMWALAIWDTYHKCLILSRDRFGIKPLYYTINDGLFSFASEIKALLELSWVTRKPNDYAITDYLVHSRVDTGNETFFNGIYRLEPGHYLKFDLSNSEIEPKIYRWWKIEEHMINSPKSDYECIQQFRELFESAIKLRLRSDVSMGTCLSGGLDSSAIVCVARPWLSKGNQKSFSACYEGFDKDESQFIDEVVKKTGIESYKTTPTAEGLLNDIERIIYQLDEPFGSTSFYAQWKVFELVKDTGVKVTLDGQGSDELLAGYHYFFPVHFAGLLKTGNFIRFADETQAFSKIHNNSMLRVLLSTAGGFLSHRQMIRLAAFLIRGRSISWVSENIRNIAGEIRHSTFFYQSDWLNKRLYDVFCNDGLPALLRLGDRNSMAHSIEARMPFLDYRLVSYLFSLSSNYKIHNGTTKYILREALKDYIPERILNRQDKIGFATPEDEWFRGPMSNMLYEIINSNSIVDRGFYNIKKLKQMADDHIAGRCNAALPLWRAMCLELWFRCFFGK